MNSIGNGLAMAGVGDGVLKRCWDKERRGFPGFMTICSCQQQVPVTSSLKETLV